MFRFLSESISSSNFFYFTRRGQGAESDQDNLGYIETRFFMKLITSVETMTFEYVPNSYHIIKQRLITMQFENNMDACIYLLI